MRLRATSQRGNSSLRRIGAVATTVALVAAACGSDDNSAATSTDVAATARPITLVTYDSFPEADTSLNDALAEFSADTGIEVEVLVAGDTGTMLSKASLTAGNPEGDVMWGVDNTLLSRAIADEVFEPYLASPIADGSVEIAPEFLDLVPNGEATPVDYGDVILWDAAPVSVRTTEAGARVVCLPLLEKLRAGDEHRFRFLGLQQQAGDIEALGQTLPSGTLLFVQEERIEFVCPRCAAGELLVRHEHQPPDEHRLVSGKIVAPAGSDLRALRDALDAASKSHAGVFLVVPGVHESLGDSATAGKAHKAWSGLERTGHKPFGPTKA